MKFFKRNKKTPDKNSNESIMNSIWESSEFKSDKKCFHYANRDFFSFCEKDTYIKNSDKRLIAIQDFNGDREISGELFSKPDNGDCIYFKSWNREPIIIADSLFEIFETIDIAKNLANRNDNIYWGWSETCYNSYEIPESVPNCVFPHQDLRLYLQEKYDFFLSDHKEFNRNSFVDYFRKCSISSLDIISDDFCVFDPNREELRDLINLVNTENKDMDFKIVIFSPSAFWGIIDKSKVSDEDFRKLKKFGLMY